MCELDGQPLHRSMAEHFASGQMLHLHNKLRVAPPNIRAGLVPTSQAIPATTEDQQNNDNEEKKGRGFHVVLPWRPETITESAPFEGKGVKERPIPSRVESVSAVATLLKTRDHPFSPR